MSYKILPLVSFPMKSFTKTFISRNNSANLFTEQEKYYSRLSSDVKLISSNLKFDSLKGAYILKLQYKIMFTPYTIRVKKNK